jgi:hypothetical protein
LLNSRVNLTKCLGSVIKGPKVPECPQPRESPFSVSY